LSGPGSTRRSEGSSMSYGIVHQFKGATKDQYEASIAAVHPADGSLPPGQMFHAAGPSADATLGSDDVKKILGTQSVRSHRGTHQGEFMGRADPNPEQATTDLPGSPPQSWLSVRSPTFSTRDWGQRPGPDPVRLTRGGSDHGSGSRHGLDHVVVVVRHTVRRDRTDCADVDRRRLGVGPLGSASAWKRRAHPSVSTK